MYSSPYCFTSNLVNIQAVDFPGLSKGRQTPSQKVKQKNWKAQPIGNRLYTDKERKFFLQIPVYTMREKKVCP